MSIHDPKMRRQPVWERNAPVEMDERMYVKVQHMYGKINICEKEKPVQEAISPALEKY